MTPSKLERLIEKIAEKLREINRSAPLPEEMNGSIRFNLNRGNIAGTVNIEINA